MSRKSETNRERKVRARLAKATRRHLDPNDDRYIPPQTREGQVLQRLARPVEIPNLTYFGIASKHLACGVLRDRLPPLLHELEVECRAKMGPRNLYQPSLLKAAINDYQRLTDVDLALPRFTILKDIALEIHDSLNLRYVVLEPIQALAALLARRVDTSAGYPYFVKRISACFPYLPEDYILQNPSAYQRAGEEWKDIGEPDVLTDKPVPMYVGNYRTESGRDGVKVRLVHAAPIANQILEARFAIPIQMQLATSSAENMREAKSMDFAHGSMFSYHHESTLHLLLSELILQAQEWGTNVISLDYSKFDAHISATLAKLGFIVLFGDESGWEEDLHTVVKHFIYKSLLTPWGIYNFNGGVPSGSLFTNLIDTSVNAIAAAYMCRAVDYAGRFNGDDGVIVTSKPIDMLELEHSARVVGLEFNASKQGISDNSCVFNRAYHDLRIPGPVPSEFKLTNSLRYYDSDMKGSAVKSADDEIYRTIQIVDALEYHPYALEILQLFASIRDNDGVMLLDYRHRIPRANITPDTPGFSYEPRYVSELDKTWLAKIYEF